MEHVFLLRSAVSTTSLRSTRNWKLSFSRFPQSTSTSLPMQPSFSSLTLLCIICTGLINSFHKPLLSVVVVVVLIIIIIIIIIIKISMSHINVSMHRGRMKTEMGKMPTDWRRLIAAPLTSNRQCRPYTTTDTTHYCMYSGNRQCRPYTTTDTTHWMNEWMNDVFINVW